MYKEVAPSKWPIIWFSLFIKSWSTYSEVFMLFWYLVHNTFPRSYTLDRVCHRPFPTFLPLPSSISIFSIAIALLLQANADVTTVLGPGLFTPQHLFGVLWFLLPLDTLLELSSSPLASIFHNLFNSSFHFFQLFLGFLLLISRRNPILLKTRSSLSRPLLLWCTMV